MKRFDRRLTPARPDLAAASLKGEVEAERFVNGDAMRVGVGVAPLRSRPDAGAMLDTELVFGEAVTVFEVKDGFAWLQSARDRYVGYAPAHALVAAGAAPTHRVASLATYLYPGPNIKLPPVAMVPMNARITATDAAGEFVATDAGAYVWAGHLAPVDAHEADFVAVAERHLGAPYLWGGRTSLGLDCSGLVQTALEAAGLAAPRDSDMQQSETGDAFALKPDLSNLRRGDLLFWKGHVGVMADPKTLLHANGHHMAVAREPVAEAIARIADKSFGQITAARRLATYRGA